MRLFSMDPHPRNAVTGGLGVVGGGSGGWPRLNSDPWIPAVALQLSLHLALSLSFLLGNRNHTICQTLELKAEQAGVRQLSLG